jgi:hypothetical protein
MKDSAQQLRTEAYSISTFCRSFNIGRSTLYSLWANGKGPRYSKPSPRRVLISADAAQEWLRSSQVESQQ